MPSSEAGSIGTNLIVGVDAIGFSDEYLDVKPFSDTWSWTDWFTGETIEESFKRERRLLTSELTLLLVNQAPTLSKVKQEMTLYLVELVVIV